jgi:[ribosomal protein S5]-alanine N-acetyltransferase
MSLETSRLRLFPMSPAALLALFEGVPQFEREIGLRVAVGLRDFYVSDEVSPDWIAQIRASTTADPWIHGFAVVERETVVGSAGYKGPPDEEGAVEIAYGIVPACQGQGYATEAAEALVAYAFDHPAVRLVRAHTLPTGVASARVLVKCGFSHIGEVLDPEDGLVWRWELREADRLKVRRGPDDQG